MMTDFMTVHVPHALYTRLEERARQTRRSVEEELIEALAEAVSLTDEPMPTDVASVLSSLETMPDDALWQVALDSHLSPTAVAHFEELNNKRQREGLTEEERYIAETLLRQYERALLVRAEAMARLKERGRDITLLLESVTA
jgi:plasmid stability protein